MSASKNKESKTGDQTTVGVAMPGNKQKFASQSTTRFRKTVTGYFPRVTLFSLLICLFCCLCVSSSSGAVPIPADRWLEIDLYWFDKTNMNQSVDTFWNRFAPLFEGVDGEKGVILNVGWLMDYILEWNGDLNSILPLPEHMTSEKYTDYTPLVGTTEQRMEAWKKRFASCKSSYVTYEKWTYGDLKKLVEYLRAEAARRGLPRMRVGTLVLGNAKIYGGKSSQWVSKHPQVFFFNGRGHHFNVEAILDADAVRYGAFPDGISSGMPIYEFFGAQWGDLSRNLNLDALVLRDCMIGWGVYHRAGPYGRNAPRNPELVERYSQANANLVKAVKLANPNVWIMGYSNGASAVADWRVNCFDLESIAKEGYLDAFIDQTWSGAWNEVGQRSETFWNSPALGWTPQLGNVLLHGAILADTKVKHYTLAETFDAWEPWDVIHAAPERLRWGIWAYLHAGVKTPSGLKFPAGTYISWANQGKQLLTAADVEFLAANISDAAEDARQTKEIFGPTLVYNRSAMEWQSRNAPNVSIKEWIDEQAGVVMKFSVPILSVTRLEYMPHVKSDLFILQTPVHLAPKEKEAVWDLIRSGEPVAIWGSPAGGLDSEISKWVNLTSSNKNARQTVSDGIAKRVIQDFALTGGIPAEFPLCLQWSENQAGPDAEVLYTVEGSPSLIRNHSNGMSVLVWDPCEYGTKRGSLTKMLGSVYPYSLVARELNQMLSAAHRLNVDLPDVIRPVMIHAWQMNNGSCRILVADTEEGIDDSAETNREVIVRLPSGWPSTFTELHGGPPLMVHGQKLDIQLPKSASRLYGN